MPRTPSAAIAANHTITTGPNSAPTRPVPWRWTENRPIRITTVVGITSGRSAGVTTSRPSTAESTEIAGVSMPSP